MKKKITSLLLAVVMVLSMSGLTCVSASAANYTSDYKQFSAPSSNDFAFWNGSRVVRASGTTDSEIMWMQAALNFCVDSLQLDADKVVVDGSHGPACSKTTGAFQQAAGLTVDQSFGPATIAAMKDILSGKRSLTSISAPASVTVKPGSSSNLTIKFTGSGIDNVSASLSGAGLNAKFTGSSWKAEGCSASLKISTDASFKGGTLTFMLVNNSRGTLQSQQIKIVPAATSSASGYNSAAALSFAKENVYKHSEWWCSEYVSRALRAGNLPISIEPVVQGLRNALTNSGTGQWYELQVESSGKISTKKNAGKIAIGDPVLLYCDECVDYDGKPWCHAVLTSTISDSYLRIYAHHEPKNSETYYNICYIHDDQAARAFVYHLN